MRNFLFLVVGLAAGAWGSEAASTRELMADPATREAVAAVKNGIVQGHRERDRDGLDRLYAEDYTATDARGDLRTKEDLLSGLDDAPEMLEGHYELVSVRRWGSIAVASGHGRMTYENPDGTTRIAEYDSVNVFELRDGRWLYVAAFLP